VTPSKEELQAKARHFANTVFVIGAGVIMLAASLLQPHAMKWMGSGMGEHFPFILATIFIFVLASKRSGFALFALERQCRKYGHVPREGSSVCERCFQTIEDQGRP
jgi:hypothetical protein